MKVLLSRDPSPTLPVCIIGAGVAGLYAAMIFESPGINYQIVDADTREHPGGRFFTYNFPNGGRYDYYVCMIPVPSHPILIFVNRTPRLCGSQKRHSWCDFLA